MLIYIIGWSCLFIIPGIIKLFSYSQVFFILVDENQKVFGNEAITRSRDIMNDKKFQLFKLQVPFLLYYVLICYIVITLVLYFTIKVPSGIIISYGIIGITFIYITVYLIPYLMIILSNFYLSLTRGNIE